ncbi:Protein lifeguard 3 [Bagarius yarrelli]|uniref:Protein lifeguard 3 n=1 Tax=Bagarius yarrelli TaxID=175774 RepID=A0A556VBV9_BAGYA|nr:Protein lifeguard 3 [Bagarius yarrelli]
MSKSDYPPGYNESRLLSDEPQPSAPPPAYNFPAYGGGHPQPGPYPGAPYSNPTAPYPGQPGMYPPQTGLPGQGYPSHSGFPGQGYPPHPGQGYPPPMPPIIPPTIPMSDSGDDGFTTTSGWENINVRHAFIRKVYLILAVQLLVTVGVVAVFTFVYYDTKSVFLALGITALVCIAVTVFCFQTKVDFTKCGGLFCVLGIVMFVTGIITAIVLSFKYIPWLHMLYAAIGAIVFTLFLAYHTQLLIGNRKHSINPEEYVFAALSVYVDVIQIFLFLLQIIGSSQR